MDSNIENFNRISETKLADHFGAGGMKIKILPLSEPVQKDGARIMMMFPPASASGVYRITPETARLFAGLLTEAAAALTTWQEA